MTTASQLLKTTRQRAGITQSKLADLSGITQSVISAYENGRRDPTVESLSTLLTCLDTRLVAAPTTPVPRPGGDIDLARNSRALTDVLALAASLPKRRPARQLAYPRLPQPVRPDSDSVAPS